MIKRLLKSVFPIAFLKACFLVYNKVKLKTLDRLLFKTHIPDETELLVYRTDYPFRLNNLDLSKLPEDGCKKYIAQWLDWTQEEYLVELKRECVIEPVYGWAIVGFNALVYESLSFSRTFHQPKPRVLKNRDISKAQRIDKAISLRDTGEENYFHFYNDVLSKLYYLRDRGIDISKHEVIISARLWERPYFQFYLSQVPWLQSLRWKVQREEYLLCTSVIFCKPMTHNAELWAQIIGPLLIKLSHNERKIFLTRNKKRLRFIENAGQIEAICQQYGLEIIDAEVMTIRDQIDIFSGAALIAGIHGAGMTNMVFRTSDCEILEIFPPPDQGYLPYHYMLLAAMHNFNYRLLVGEPGREKFSGGFYLSPEEFERVLIQLSSKQRKNF